MNDSDKDCFGMLKGMRGKKFSLGQEIYVFEYGEGKILQLKGYDKSRGEEVYKVRIGSTTKLAHSSNCFAYKKDGVRHRFWNLKNAQIEITYEPIKLIFHGQPTWVKYSDDEDDREIFEEGDELHKDWEGMGIDFSMIIAKWLRRLNGEKIPLSNYYKDPVNRYFDNLG